MYFDKLYQKMKDFALQVDGAREGYQATLKQIETDYGKGGRLYDEKRAQAKELYETTKKQLVTEGLKIVNDTMEKVTTVIDEFVTRPVPADFAGTIEALRITGEELTKAEAKVFIEKYKNNYLAARSITKVMRDNAGVNNPIVSVDELKTDLERMRGYAEKYFREYNAGNYLCAVLIHEKSPLTDYDAVLNTFINEDVSIYAAEER